MGFGKSSQAFLTNALGPLASNIRPSVRNLGVILNGSFKFQEERLVQWSGGPITI